MARIVPAAVLVVLAASSMAFGQEANVVKAKRSRSNGSVEQAIQRLHLEYGQAQLTNDIAMLERVWADDHTFTNTFGVVQTKAERLAEMKSGARKLESFKLDDIQVRVYGNTAVVTSRATLKMQLRGQEISLQARGIDVYVRKKGWWQLVAAQATRIAQQQPMANDTDKTRL